MHFMSTHSGSVLHNSRVRVFEANFDRPSTLFRNDVLILSTFCKLEDVMSGHKLLMQYVTMGSSFMLKSLIAADSERRRKFLIVCAARAHFTAVDSMCLETLPVGWN